jgi:hypothetical protein
LLFSGFLDFFDYVPVDIFATVVVGMSGGSFVEEVVISGPDLVPDVDGCSVWKGVA